MKKIRSWLPVELNIPFIILNNIDIEFFQYNQKRITSDFLDLIFLGNDTLQIFPNYLIQYWPLVILSFFQFFLITRISDYKFENVQSVGPLTF